ncbi:hypothetical protein ARMGADRAFT_1033757 [Armillaria gallica]|uniref:CxC2-like cysteine cluster KDZ transposase-associated domain-containing protein n=1 Tax=Armillaria gallica TaxID=47427 RepID=A0A2H3D0F5_ARMGA|nr:hypothetical protein ARMGADRAFT_1033757 [Armillaria gallica]
MLKMAGHGNEKDGIATTPPGSLALKFKNWYQSNWQRDPGLHTGLAYFVEPVKYLEHVTQFASQKDISMCSGFQTLAHAESRNATGLHAMGVGMYCNMDYIALSAAQGHGIKSLFWSYDIACQWKLNLFEQMAELLSALQQDPIDIKFCFAIPKCHCKGHKLKCQCYHSMNIQIIGHTDREGIEQKRKIAKKKAIKHIEGFQALTDVLPRNHFVKEWTAEIESWEQDNTLPSPYFIEVTHMMEAEVLLNLKEQERLAVLKDGISFSDSMAASCVELALVAEDLHLFTHCNKNVCGQKQNTCVAEAAHWLDTKCKLAASKYNTAWNALLILQGPGDWEQTLHELWTSNCMSLHGSVLEIDSSSEEEDVTKEGLAAKRWQTQSQPQGEGHKEVSWIWMQEGALGDGEDEALNQVVKLEWLKSRACSMWWQEEGILVEEEMRHTLLSLEWEA